MSDAGAGTGLSTTVPIFPLSGVLLLPGARLPLHVFEARYRAMTRDALAGDRLIAMIQPVPGEESADHPDPPIHPVGCVGRIENVEESEDGRYFLTLKGIARFRVVEELPQVDGYRRVVADYDAFPDDMVPGDVVASIDRDRLFGALETYLSAHGMAADWGEAGRAPDAELVNALAMAVPFGPVDKQALLEAPDIAARAELLVGLCEMGARTSGAVIASNDNDPSPPH